MKVTVVGSSALQSGPWGTWRFILPDVSQEARELAQAVQHYRRLARGRHLPGSARDWDALGTVVNRAVERFVAKNRTSQDRELVYQRIADVKFVAREGIVEIDPDDIAAGRLG